jgi:hypothetical protein
MQANPIGFVVALAAAAMSTASMMIMTMIMTTTIPSILSF